MADDPMTRPKTLKDLKKDTPSEQEVLSRVADVWPTNDYETVLVSSSLLEYMLGQAIKTRFVPLNADQMNSVFSDGGNGPLSAFSAKIKIAHALGFLSTEGKAEIERIKEIRNLFAHHKEALSFKHPTISMECKKLTSSIFEYGVKGFILAEHSAEKYQFLASCTHYLTSLAGQIRAVVERGSVAIQPHPIQPEDRAKPKKCS